MDSRYLIMGPGVSQDDAGMSPIIFSTQEMNAAILSSLNLPNYLIDNALLIKKEKEKITSLRLTVERSDAIAKVTVFTLSKFLHTINSLEQLLTPMHRETVGIVTAQRNIERTLREVHGVLDNLDVLTVKKDPNTGQILTQDSLSERLQGDYEEFIHHLFQLLESQKYWTINIKFSGADRILKRLNELISHSAQTCALEFDKILSMSSKPIDISRLGWPLPSKFEWVADTVLDRLGLIAQGLVVSQNSGIDQKILQNLQQHQEGYGSVTCKPLHSLLVNRTPFIKATYKLLLQNHSALVQGGGFGQFLTKISKPTKRSKKVPQFYALAESSRTAHPSITRPDQYQQQHQHQQQIIEEDQTTTTTSELTEDGEQLGRYVKGTHQIIFLTDVLLGVLELELHTWETILSRCEGLEQEDLDNAFCMAITPVLTTFSRVIADFLSTPSPNKLLFTLDVLGHFQKLQSRFRQTLKRGVDKQDSYRIFMQVKSDVTYSLQTSLLEHIIDSVKISKFSKAARRDGSIADVTVETVTFLRALCTYDDVLDILPPEVAYTATTKPFFTETGSKPAISTATTTTGPNQSNTPTLQDVITLNQRLSNDAKEKYSAENNGSTQGFVWRTVLPLSILPGLTGTHGLCTVSQGVVWDVLQGLDATLQVRADALKGPSLQWLFYLNNYHYIAQSATKHYFRVHPLFLTYYINKTQRSKVLYQTHTFQNLLQFLDTTNYDKKIELQDKRAQREQLHTPGVIQISNQYAKLIKSKFAGFNKGFKEIFQLQKLYSVPDGDLRGQLRSESVDIIIPMFEKFIDKYGQLPFSTKHKADYLCYTKELLETLLNKFFDELT